MHNGETALGPGKVELLAYIAETGSIGEAASKMGMSYMRAWTLVNTMNQSFKEPLVNAQRGGKTGGGASLTKTGQQVLKLYRQIETKTRTATKPRWLKLRSLLRD